MRNFIIKYSEYIITINLFIINIILVGIFKFNFVILNLVHFIVLIIVKYIIYLPYDKLEIDSIKKCDFKKCIDEFKKLTNILTSEYIKNTYLIRISLYKNIINPTNRNIESYINLISKKNVLTQNQQISYDAEMLLICLLLEKKEESDFLWSRISKNNKSNNKMTNLIFNRTNIIFNLFNNNLDNIENDMNKHFVLNEQSNNLYQEIKRNFLLGVYYYKNTNYDEARNKFENIITKNKEIFLVTKSKELIKNIDNL